MSGGKGWWGAAAAAWLLASCAGETVEPGAPVGPEASSTPDEAAPPPDDAAPGGGGDVTPTDLVGAGDALPEPGTPEAPDAGAPVPDAGPPQTPRFDGRFILGADISGVPELEDFGVVFVDTDGVAKDMLELLQNHGFNYVRLRTFVDPGAEYGYASGSLCTAKAEPYADKDHTVEIARRVKAAGMGLLLDFHYSDTWADPGKQVIPEAWRGSTSIAELAEHVRAYTVDVVSALVDAGARPDMVQVGNEITPGMLIHVPTAQTDCYGNGSVENPTVNGSQRRWDDLATLLRSGIDAVKSVDDEILVMLHLENTASAAGVSDWVQNAQARGVAFDVLGLSAYEAFQGPSSAWRATLTTLAEAFPELSFAIAEYNPERRLLNDIMRELPDGRGLGTFFWEPTQSGSWGQAMFTWEGNTARANEADFAEYDRMRVDYGL